MLLASGDVRIVRVWDAHREMKVQVRYFIEPYGDDYFVAKHRIGVAKFLSTKIL